MSDIRYDYVVALSKIARPDWRFVSRCFAAALFLVPTAAFVVASAVAKQRNEATPIGNENRIWYALQHASLVLARGANVIGPEVLTWFLEVSGIATETF